MQIYIADLQAYNSGYLKGEWIKLPTEEDDIQDAILRQSQNRTDDCNYTCDRNFHLK